MVTSHPHPRSILRTSRPRDAQTGEFYSYTEYHRRFSPKSVTFGSQIRRRDLVPAQLPTSCPDIVRAVGYREVACDSTYSDPEYSKWWIAPTRERERERAGRTRAEWQLLNQEMYTREHFVIPNIDAERKRQLEWMNNPLRWQALMGVSKVEDCLPIYYEELNDSDTEVDGELEAWDWTGLEGYDAPVTPPAPAKKSSPTPVNCDVVEAYLAEQRAKIDQIERDIQRCYPSPVSDSSDDESYGKRKSDSCTSSRAAKRTKH